MVERGRALRYRACAQDLTCHFGGAVHPPDPPDQADQAEVVACPAGRTLPSTRAGGQDDVSYYTNSLKLCF